MQGYGEERGLNGGTKQEFARIMGHLQCLDFCVQTSNCVHTVCHAQYQFVTVIMCASIYDTVRTHFLGL